MQNLILKQRLTLRYMVALAAVALVLLISFATIFHQVELSKKDAYLVNISGMQRMLSQRTALMVREIQTSNNIGDADVYFDKLKMRAQKMRDNHEQLISGNLTDGKKFVLSPALKDIYLSENGLDKRVKHYLSLLGEFETIYQERGLAAAKASSVGDEIVTIAGNGLLEALNGAVSQFAKEAEAKTLRFRQIEMCVLLSGLIILMLEILFIFRPMVKSVTQSFKSLMVANAELVEFSYRISHDLKAPILSTKGLADVCSDAIKNNNLSIASHAVDHIKISMDKLEVLIDDVLNLTKCKMKEVDPETVNISLLIDGILSNVSNLTNAKRIDFQKNVSFQNPLLIKRVYLQQTLENFISNAIKYHNYDQESPFIRVDAKLMDNYCVIDVIDNGIGVPENSQKDLFGMFRRFHPGVSFGSGLGLYLTAQNAAAMDGEVHYAPMDPGSKFTIRFPYNKA